MSSDLASCYARARKLAAVVELQLEVPPTSFEARQALSGNTNALFAEVAILERAIDALPPASPENRLLWQKRLSQLQQDGQQLRKTVEQLLRRTYERSRVELDRSELLGTVSGGLYLWWESRTATSRPSTILDSSFCQGNGAQQAVVVDALARERESITSSSRLIDDVTGLAGSIADALRGQRGVLKGAHRKVLDVSQTLGLSSSLMRVISRRTTADKILVYGGFAVILVLVLIVYWLR